MTPELYLWSALVLTLASVAQSAVGFGYALFPSPILIWMGVPLEQTVALVATCSMMQSVFGVRRLRKEVKWRISFIASGIRFIGLILGTLALRRLATWSAADIRLTVGIILCVLVALQCLWRPHPAERLHWGWAGLAFSASGLLAGISGMGGPPLVLWAMAHDWSSHKTRAFFFSVFLIAIPVQLVLLAYTFNAMHIASVIATGLACTPLVWLGSKAGLAIGHRLSKERLRIVAYMILFAMGASAAIPALWQRFNIDAFTQTILEEGASQRREGSSVPPW